MIRIVIADDHPVVRAGLRALLDGEEDLDVAYEAANVVEAVAHCQRGGIDLVLMDLQFSDGPSGVDGTRMLRELDDPPRVLVLTNYDTDADILGTVEAGASGYLLKDRGRARRGSRSECFGSHDRQPSGGSPALPHTGADLARDRSPRPRRGGQIESRDRQGTVPE